MMTAGTSFAHVELGRLPLVTHLEEKTLDTPAAKKTAPCTPTADSGKTPVKPAFLAGEKDDACTIPTAAVSKDAEQSTPAKR